MIGRILRPAGAEGGTPNPETGRDGAAEAWGVIAEGIREDDPTNSYTWKVPAALEGQRVYLLATITDGIGAGLDYTAVAIAVGDSDHDGLPDAWERLYWSDLSYSSHSDPDGDGWNNGDEYRLGTNPADPASRPDWSFDLYVSGASLPDLTIGYATDASNGFDAAYDIATSATSIYLAGPDTLQYPALRRSILARPDGTLAWRLVANPSHGPVEIAWDPSQIPADHGLFLTPLTSAGRSLADSLDMVAFPSGYATLPTQFEIELEPPRTYALELQPGWNLISIPVQPTDNTVATLFRGRQAGRVWSCRLGPGVTPRYEVVTELDAKTGVWLYWSGKGREAIDLRGRPLRDALVHLDPGWNLVGPIGPCDIPDNASLAKPVWRWDPAANAYVGAGGKMLPGYAYWCFVRAPMDVWLGE
jgi:hypothetical protein